MWLRLVCSYNAAATLIASDPLPGLSWRITQVRRAPMINIRVWSLFDSFESGNNRDVLSFVFGLVSVAVPVHYVNGMLTVTYHGRTRCENTVRLNRGRQRFIRYTYLYSFNLLFNILFSGNVKKRMHHYRNSFIFHK